MRGSFHRRLPVVDASSTLQLASPNATGTLALGSDHLQLSDGALLRRQPYPGHQLPDLSGRARFPAPDRPGEYCSQSEFEQAPKFISQFVHWKDRMELVLEGRYHELPPVHFEGIFTLVCNFLCPHCTRRVTRTRWVEGGTWENNTEVEKKNTMHPEDLKRALDQAAQFATDGQMGIIWGGGDPTGNPFTYDAMLYAASLGLTSSFLTNGVFLDVDRALDPEPVLIRISLNCGTEDAYRRFHGYPKGWDYFERVRNKMRELARRRVERGTRTLVGISLILDERNLADAVAAGQEIVNVHEASGGGIDYVIVRPVMNYGHFEGEWARLHEHTKARAQELVSETGALGALLKAANIPLVPIKDSFDERPPESDYEDTQCLAYGVCSEIRHNGDVQLCSDSYGNPEYTIGNLRDATLADIWSSTRRAEVLRAINDRECYRTSCPHNSRGHHFNRLFHRIERKRREGRIDDVRRWAEDLRRVTYPLGHSFFI